MTAPRPTSWDDVPVVLDVAAAGRLLGLGKNATYLAVQRGDIPSIAIGRRLLVPRDRLRAMLESAAEGGR
jgi:excisionase family DNA binding protein